MTKKEQMKMNNDCTLDLKQREQADRTINSIIGGEYGILKFVEDLRNELTSREAEIRAKAIDVVCYVLLKLIDENGRTFSATEFTSLLDFLLSKMEDSGHLSELLIATLHKMITTNFGPENSYQDEQLEQIFSTLFVNNNAQSYGQKDRIILYSIFEHLLNIQFKQFPSMAPQKTIQYFLGSAQGEQDPRVLLIIFRIHQKLASQTKLGIFLEDMFDIISCYFPIDFEPVSNKDKENENDKDSPSITSEMLHCGLEGCLLANNSFGPFCFQLICEKLTENDSDIDGQELIKRQLAICKFFINACQRFKNIGKILEENLEELMAAFRSIFLNPAQNGRILNRTEQIITEAMKSLVKAYSENGGMNDLERIGEKMTKMTIENIEPFILQAEMGTMGGGFRMIKSLSETLVENSAQSKVIWQRSLYWLDLLINGKTLRSPQNREEIAMEAIELMPYWLRKCILDLDEFGEENRNLMNETLHPLLAGIFSMEEDEENEKLLRAKCQILIAANPLQKNEQFCNFFHQNFHSICQRGNELICTDEINQFLAKYAQNEFCEINGEFFDECLQKGQFNILPPIICPFQTELEGEKVQFEEKILQNSKAAINVILTISFDQIFSANRSKIQKENIPKINECCQTIENTAKRLNSFGNENEKTKMEFYKELKIRIDTFLQFNEEEPIKSTTTIFVSIALLLQNIGQSLNKNLHNDLCKWAIQNCKLPSKLSTKLRTFWLLLLQNKDFQFELIQILLQLIRTENNFGYIVLLFFQEALFSFYFAIYNRGKMQPELREQIILALDKLQQNQSENEHDSVEEEEKMDGINQQFVNFNLFKQNLCQNVNLRIELLEMRSTLLAGKPKTIEDKLIEFFDKIISQKEMQNNNSNSIAELLDFFLPQNDPAKCFYQKSPSWQQKIFTIFVPIFVKYFDIIHRTEFHSKEKKMQMLTLLGPLMQILGQIPSTDSLTDELMQLGPLIAESLPITMEDDCQSSFLATSMLDGLCLLLKKKKQKATNDGQHFTPKIVHSIGLCICKRICRENLPLPIIVKMLECLQILPNQFGREWLAPVCIPVVQALAEMASHPKRFIRQKAAGTRNSWELIF